MCLDRLSRLWLDIAFGMASAQTQGFLLPPPYMKQWYEFYSSEIAQQKLPQLVGEIQSANTQAGMILQQPVGDIDFPTIFGLVPWGHHIPLNCYVVIELKAVPFQPEFAGKLNFYVNAVDDLIKTPSQNPTIGLLICSDKNDTNVQYAFKGITTPMGVASYDNVKVKEIQDQLPSVEELTKRIRLLEEQLNKKKD